MQDEIVSEDSDSDPFSDGGVSEVEEAATAPSVSVPPLPRSSSSSTSSCSTSSSDSDDSSGEDDTDIDTYVDAFYTQRRSLQQPQEDADHDGAISTVCSRVGFSKAIAGLDIDALLLFF